MEGIASMPAEYYPDFPAKLGDGTYHADWFSRTITFDDYEHFGPYPWVKVKIKCPKKLMPVLVKVVNGKITVYY